MALGALLLCAGLGTRLRPYSDQLPKPAIPFWGLPLSYYSLYFLREADCREITMNLHHLPEKMQALTKRDELRDFRFQFSLEKDKAMGSGGALYYAKNHLQPFSSFFAINSDEVMIPPSADILSHLSEHFQKTKALATLLVTDHPDLQKTLKPVWINKDGVIRGFGDKPSSTEVLKPVHYTGYKIFSNEVLSLLPAGESHIFHDTLVPAMNAGALVNTLFVDCSWWETGSLAGLLKATADVTQMVAQSGNKNHLQQVYESFGRDFSFTTSCSAQKTVAIHRSSNVRSEQCSGTVFVGANSQAAADIRLENCLVDHSLKIKKNLNQTLLLNLED